MTPLLGYAPDRDNTTPGVLTDVSNIIPNERGVVGAPSGVAPSGVAALAAECLVTGKELLATPEHALHVLEIITAARESSATGKRVALTSTFKWPVVS